MVVLKTALCAAGMALLTGSGALPAPASAGMTCHMDGDGRHAGRGYSSHNDDR